MNLPILSAGKQEPGSGQVCAEQAVNWLVSGRLDLGAESDHPECVQPVLNALAIAVNDRISDEGRQRMWPLILAQPGTARPDLEPELTLYLATWLAIYVAPLAAAWAAHAASAAACAADAAAPRRPLCLPAADAAAYAANAADAADYAADAAHAATPPPTPPPTTRRRRPPPPTPPPPPPPLYAADAAYAAAAHAAADDALIALLTDAQAELRDLIGYDDVCEITDDRVERLGILVGTR